jgi:hypothetical protein
MSLNIDYICCNSKSDFVWYTKSFKYDVVVNYNDIVVNLVKSDIMNVTPSVSIVNLYIRKKILKIMEDSLLQESSKFAYFIKDLEEDSIDGIFSLVLELAKSTNVKYTNNLIIINHDGVLDKNILAKFNSIKFINR